MSAVKTLDVKGLEHGEREEKIFPGIENLEPGETLRIVVEFNPAPLVYLIQAKEGYSVSYEKEGPDEWILLITKAKAGDDRRKQQFKDLLKELKIEGASESAKEKARTLLGDVDATTLGVLEQELIEEGVSHDEIRKSLCDIHLEVLRDSLVEKRIEVSAPHPIHTFMEEHVIILDSLRQLAELVARLKEKNSFDEMGADLENLEEIAHHLVEAESHHQREEDVLFPELEKHGITEPTLIMKMDHVEFRKRKQALYKLARSAREHDFNDFKQQVIELGEYLNPELESHIFKEDNIIYQIALQTLQPEQWEKVKKLCDELGYCCFTPEDQKTEEGEEAKMVELDLREIMPFERHDLIFQKWDVLKPGETLKIINDHDPKPLRYQFMAEYTDQFEWEYDQEGPKDWIVRIKRVK